MNANKNAQIIIIVIIMNVIVGVVAITILQIRNILVMGKMDIFAT